MSDSRVQHGAHDTPWMSAETILTFAHHGLGDAVFMIPALRALRIRFPRARILVTVASREIGELLTTETGCDKFVLFRSALTGNHDLLVRGENPQDTAWKLLQFAWQMRREKVMMIIGSYVMRSSMLAALKLIVGARWLVGASHVPGMPRFFDGVYFADTPIHASAENLAIMEAANVPIPADIEERMPSIREFAAQLPSKLSGRRYIVFHITTARGREFKSWPRECFQQLAAYAKNLRSVETFVVGDANEREVLEDFARCANCSVATGSFIELLGLTRGSLAFVGNDSGWLHVAAALGVPSIGIFGPTDPVRYRPLGRHTDYLYSDFVCSPCFEVLSKGCGLPTCMSAIPVNHVIQHLESILNYPEFALARPKTPRKHEHS